MNTKFLIFLTWIFFIAMHKTSDEVWLFCTAASGVLTACSCFYHLGHKDKADKKEKTKS